MSNIDYIELRRKFLKKMSHTSKIYSNTVNGKVNHPKENVNAR